MRASAAALLACLLGAGGASPARADVPPPPPLLDEDEELIDLEAPAPPASPPPAGRRRVVAPGPVGDAPPPPPPPASAPVEGGAAFLGAATGCGAGALFPAATTALMCASAGGIVGLGTFGAGGLGSCLGPLCVGAACGTCVMGPFAGGGAVLGAGIGSLLDGSEPLTSVGYASPGLVVGVIGLGLTGLGLVAASSTGTPPPPGVPGGQLSMPVALMGLGWAMQLAAGPVALAGLALGERQAEEEEALARERAGIEQRPPPWSREATLALSY